MEQEEYAMTFLMKVRNFLQIGRILTTFEREMIKSIARKIRELKTQDERYAKKADYDCIPDAIFALLVHDENNNCLIRKVFVDAGIMNKEWWIIFIGNR